MLCHLYSRKTERKARRKDCMNTKKANAQRKFARLSFSRNSSRLFDSREVSGVSSKSVRRFLNGRFSRFINGTARSISLTSTRTFGGAFMSFGLISLILHLLEYYFVEESTVALSSLVISAALHWFPFPLSLLTVRSATRYRNFR